MKTDVNILITFKLKLINETNNNQRFKFGYVIKDKYELESFKNVFLYDYLTQKEKIKLWITKEFGNVKVLSTQYTNLNQATFQPILPFRKNDSIYININLITAKGIIDITSFDWITLQMKNLNNYNYENEKSFKNNEIEQMINTWTELKSQFIDIDLSSLINILKENFKIVKISFDDVGVLLYRIQLTATIKGKIENDIYGIFIEVKNKGETVANEVRKNGLLFENKKFLELREGDDLVIYINKNKF